MLPSYSSMVVVCVLATAVLHADADVVSRASSAVSAESGEGCGYDQTRLHFLCLFCNASSCGIYSVPYRGTPFLERGGLPGTSGAVTVKTFTVQSGRRLAYIYFSNHSLIQYNMDSFAAAPLDTGFSFTSTTSSVVGCSTVSLSAPSLLTVSPDGKAYGVLTTSAACANTLHVVEYVVPSTGTTTGATQSTIVITLSGESSPGSVISITAGSSLSASSAVLFVALSGGATCTSVAYVKIVPRASTPTASQLTCGGTSCSLTATAVSGVMLAYRDLDGDLIATHRSCHLAVSISSDGIMRVFSGTGVSGYRDGFATSEARLESPSSPTLAGGRRVFLLTVDGGTTDLVGRLTGSTNTESMTKTVSVPSHTPETSSTSSMSVTETVTQSLTTSPTPTASGTKSTTSSKTLSSSLPTLTDEMSLSGSRSMTPSLSNPSVSQTETDVGTSSPTSTVTASASHEDSGSQSLSSSPSSEPSSTGSESHQSTYSGTSTTTSSVSPSVTTTGIESVTPSASRTVVVSGTPRWQSKSISVSQGASLSFSPTLTGTPTGELSATVTIYRLSATRSPSRATVSSRLTLSAIISGTLPSPTLSTSLSSVSATVSVTRTITLSLTTSPSTTVGASAQRNSREVRQYGTSSISLTEKETSTKSASAVTETSRVSITDTLTIVPTSTVTTTSTNSPSQSVSKGLFYPAVGDNTVPVAVIIGSILGGVAGVGGAVLIYYYGFQASHTAAPEGHAPSCEQHATDVHAYVETNAPDGEVIEVEERSEPRSVSVVSSCVSQQRALEAPHGHPIPPTAATFDGGALPWWATGGVPPPPSEAAVGAPTEREDQQLSSVYGPVSHGSLLAFQRMEELKDVTVLEMPQPTEAQPSGWWDPDEDSGDEQLWFEPEDGAQ